MNAGNEHGNHLHEHGDFDAKLRQVHARAVEHVSPRTFVQLRARRSPSGASAPNSPRHAWPLAATCAIALVAGGLFLREPAQHPAADSITATTDNEPGDVYAALDESPELYLWLASSDTDLVTE